MVKMYLFDLYISEIVSVTRIKDPAGLHELLYNRDLFAYL